MDRPSRKSKTVNYCESKDFDDDDEDFACVKAPPCKKPREDHKQQTQNKPSSQESNSQSSVSQRSRKPLDDKLFDRDLDAAITLSLLNNGDGTKEQSPTSRVTPGEAVKLKPPADENTDPSSLRLSNCSVNPSLLGLDEITSEKYQRKAASKATEEQRKHLQREDEDYQPKLTPESESDEDFSEQSESEDEEFTAKKIPKKKEKVIKNETKKPPAPKKDKQPSKSKSKSQSSASTPARTPAAAKPAATRTPASASGSTAKPTVSLSPAGGRTPKWNPPGQVGKSPSSSLSPAARSPGQGLRLGLSRRVRVKPLHPSVASH